MTRRATLAVLAALLLCAAATVTGWRARPARAAASLYAYQLNAEARAIQVFQDDPTGNARNAEGEVPEARANLNTGPVGYALATVAWPGPLAANAGSLILVASAQAPPQVTVLNDPVRAEARTGQNPPTTTYNDVPGTSLTATAKNDLVSADASVGSTLASTGTFGPARAAGKTALSGGSATSESSNIVNDIVLAGGAVTIKSVSSMAKATTDGSKGTGSASATVAGLTIGGQPASIDEKGLHIGASGQPVNEAANKAARQALSQGGIDIVLSAPTKEIKGSAATVTAGSLIVSWKPADNAVFGAIFGGAQASASGTPGGDETLSSLTGDTFGTGGPTSTGGAGAASGSSGDISSPGGIAGGSTLPAVAGQSGAATLARSAAPQVGLATTPAAAHGTLIKIREVVVLLLLAMIVAGALKGLSDYVLAVRLAATPCSLEDDE